MMTSDATTFMQAGKLDETRLAAELQQALQATIFDSGLRIAPKRMHQIVQEVATAFRRFLEEHEHTDAAYTFGQYLADAGVGHRTLLALMDVFHHTCWESAATTTGRSPASVRYGTPLLAGYMARREAYLLQEQERTRLALERARTRDTN